MKNTIHAALVATIVAAPLTLSAQTTTSTASTGSTTAPAVEEAPKEVTTSAKPAEPSSDAAKATERVLATADQAIPREFVIYENAAIDAFLKPVLQLSSTLVGFDPQLSNDSDVSGRLSTLLIARFGLEGRITTGVTFRSVFERNAGFNLARGPVGTSIWEGTASLQARESYIKLERWGLSIAGGIVPDPASLDFTSVNAMDMFGMDPYTRDPLLFTGANQGQGFLVRYSRWNAALGFAFTAGNPLVSSTSLAFGGNVSALGTLFQVPLRATTSGVPGSEIQMAVFGPSLTYEHEYFDVKLAAQFYDVDVDLLSQTDANLAGLNLRGTVQLKSPVYRVAGWPMSMRLFGSLSMRTNEQFASVTDLTTKLDDEYSATTFGAGADLDWGDLSVGGMYYQFKGTNPSATDTAPDVESTLGYVNVGASYWIWQHTVAAGVRFAMSTEDNSETSVTTRDTKSVIGSLRLVL
ncbi:hypothetical protein L6R52_06165 [Myxococcota bacterium]|nr:hypothetical protein [Myxococcota bacterium]